MNKGKKIREKAEDTPDSYFDSIQYKSDQEILEEMEKRKEESQALIKLLDNLNTPFPKK